MNEWKDQKIKYAQTIVSLNHDVEQKGFEIFFYINNEMCGIMTSRILKDIDVDDKICEVLSFAILKDND